ncbi:MAG: recombinase family protein [Acidobacteriota bacterium]|nr:recombinase family protein [Acidobacteriota bacterium]
MIALYARVSTDAQTERGLQSQLAELRGFAKQKYSQLTPVEFVDDGYTGAVLERPAMDELRRMLAAKKFSAVVAYDADRLSRELAHLLLLMKELERAQVVVDFVRGGFEQTDSGRMMLQMRGVIAEYERTQIRARTQRGRLEAARQGRSGGGRRTFGYTSEGGVLSIAEDEAVIVRRIFDSACSGKSIRSLAFVLNAEGVLPQRGRKWATSSLHRILGNETYFGLAYYNRRRRGSDEGRFRSEQDWISIPVPAIVTRERFEEARRMLAQNSTRLAGPHRPYMLRGLLRCGHCGRGISGNASHGKRYYRCGGRDRLRNGDPCRAGLILAERIERTITSGILDALKSGLLTDAIADRNIVAVDYAAETAKARREVQTWRDSEERAVMLMVSPAHATRRDLFERELNRATEKRQAAEARLVHLENSRKAENEALVNGSQMEAACERAYLALELLTTEGWRQGLSRLVDEITVRGRELEVRGAIPRDSIRSQHQHIVDGSIPFTFRLLMEAA